MQFLIAKEGGTYSYHGALLLCYLTALLQLRSVTIEGNMIINYE
jgi:hypothetical protein